MKYFCYFLKGRKYTVFTDHKPILSALKNHSEPSSGQQARQLAEIAEATTDILHIGVKTTKSLKNSPAHP